MKIKFSAKTSFYLYIFRMLCSEKVQRKYAELSGEFLLIDLDKGPNGLGLSLAGNRDRTKLSVFVVGLTRDFANLDDGQRVIVGDELLEVYRDFL